MRYSLLATKWDLKPHMFETLRPHSERVKIKNVRVSFPRSWILILPRCFPSQAPCKVSPIWETACTWPWSLGPNAVFNRQSWRLEEGFHPLEHTIQGSHASQVGSRSINWSNTATSYRQMAQRMEAPTVLNKAGGLKHNNIIHTQNRSTSIWLCYHYPPGGTWQHDFRTGVPLEISVGISRKISWPLHVQVKTQSN